MSVEGRRTKSASRDACACTALQPVPERKPKSLSLTKTDKMLPKNHTDSAQTEWMEQNLFSRKKDSSSQSCVD